MSENDSEVYAGYSVDDEDPPQGDGESMSDDRGLAVFHVLPRRQNEASAFLSLTPSTCSSSAGAARTRPGDALILPAPS